MIMGKIVSRAKYEYYEYLTALLISLGMGLFLWSVGPGGKFTDHASSLSGFILLSAYLIADSFTSNWQGTIFLPIPVPLSTSLCRSSLPTASHIFRPNDVRRQLILLSVYRRILNSARWFRPLYRIYDAGKKKNVKNLFFYFLMLLLVLSIYVRLPVVVGVFSCGSALHFLHHIQLRCRSFCNNYDYKTGKSKT